MLTIHSGINQNYQLNPAFCKRNNASHRREQDERNMSEIDKLKAQYEEAVSYTHLCILRGGGHPKISSFRAKKINLCQYVIKPAFTLSETLITLAVIGIVAAMTLPS